MVRSGGKTGGRKKGVTNKVNAEVKDNIIAVFNKIGGIDNMAAWAQKNSTEFYRLYGRLIPTDVNASHDGKIVVEIVKFSGTKD